MDGLGRVSDAFASFCDGLRRGAAPDADALDTLAKFLLAFFVAAQVGKLTLSNQTPAAPKK